MHFLDITVTYEGDDFANEMTIQSNDYLAS